jgi:hypothetical protein
MFDTPNERITSHAGWKHPEHTTEFRPDDARTLLDHLGFTVTKLVGHWLCEGEDGFLRINKVSEDGPYPREQRMREGLDNPSASFSWWVEARFDGNAVPDKHLTRRIVENMWRRYGHSNYNRTISTDADFVVQKHSGKEGRFVQVVSGWTGNLVRSTQNALPPGRVRVGVQLEPYDFTTSPGYFEVVHPATGRTFGRSDLPAQFDGGIVTIEVDVPGQLLGRILIFLFMPRVR